MACSEAVAAVLPFNLCLISKELTIDSFNGVKPVHSGRRGAQRDVVHLASAATHQMHGFGPRDQDDFWLFHPKTIILVAIKVTEQLHGFNWTPVALQAGWSRLLDFVMFHSWSIRPRREACLATNAKNRSNGSIVSSFGISTVTRLGTAQATAQSVCFARTLAAGDVVILDNLGSHKGKAARTAIRKAGAHILFLPAYSPDLNAIEQVFAKLKHLMRHALPRTIKAAWQKVGHLLIASNQLNARTTLQTQNMLPYENNMLTATAVTITQNRRPAAPVEGGCLVCWFGSRREHNEQSASLVGDLPLPSSSQKRQWYQIKSSLLHTTLLPA